MKKSHTYLWVQKKDHTESNFMVANNRVIKEGDDDYPALYNHYYSLLSGLKRKYEKDGLVISSGFGAVAISGNFNERDVEGRRVPYSFYDESGNGEDTSLVRISSELGYSVPNADIELFRKFVIHKNKRKKTAIYTGITLAVILGALLIALK